MSTPETTGIYRGVPEPEYRKWLGLNASLLKLLKKSPAHFKHELDNPSPKTPAMELGCAVHDAVLSPNFGERYIAYPGTRRGKAWEEFKEQHQDRIIVTQAVLDETVAISKAIVEHPTMQRFLDNALDTEVSALWDSEVLCKGRADILCPKFDAIVDIKTTTDASREAFERAIFNQGYALQAAHYLEGFNAEKACYEHFVFAVVEKSPPYAMALYRLEDDVLELAREEIAKLKEAFKSCAADEFWPAYPNHIQDISIPKWAKRQMEEDNE